MGLFKDFAQKKTEIEHGAKKVEQYKIKIHFQSQTVAFYLFTYLFTYYFSAYFLYNVLLGEMLINNK